MNEAAAKGAGIRVSELARMGGVDPDSDFTREDVDTLALTLGSLLEWRRSGH